MSSHQASDTLSNVSLSLELDSTLSSSLGSGGLLHKAVSQALMQGLSELMATLGIPGAPFIEIAAAPENALPPGSFLRLFVNGQICRYPREILQRAYCYVTASLPGPATRSDTILAWLKNQAEDASLDQQPAADFLSLACMEIIKRQPAVLLGVGQVNAYRDSLLDVDPQFALQTQNWPPERLLPILHSVLRLRISIADTRRVAKILATIEKESQADICEALLDALYPNEIEIQLPLEYLRQITLTGQENDTTLFTTLRKNIFQDIALLCPAFRFVPVEHLKSHSFRFKINHLTTLPWIGLSPEQYLVPKPASIPEAYHLETKPILHPRTGAELQRIELSPQSRAALTNAAAFNHVSYLAMCLEADLRDNLACLVQRQLAHDQLTQIQSMYPALVKVVRSEMPVTQLVRLIRALVAEEISVKNMKLVLESLLAYAYDNLSLKAINDRPIPEEQGKDVLCDSNLLSFVRSRLKRQIKQKYIGTAQELQAYLLHPNIIQALQENQPPLSEGEQKENQRKNEEIIQAIRATLDKGEFRIPIITSDEIRPLLRPLIAPEFPHTPLLAFQELPPDINIRQVAVISFGEAAANYA